jgi:hypothetical protein
MYECDTKNYNNVLQQKFKKPTSWLTLNFKELKIEQNFVFSPDIDKPIASFAGKSPHRAIIILGKIWAGYNPRVCTTNVASTVCEGKELNSCTCNNFLDMELFPNC